jgi:hypothetical protein
LSREPDLLPSLRELGDRLGDAAAREIADEQAAAPRRRRRRWPFVAGGVAVALVAAGGVTATDIFTGSGEPVPEEKSSESQAGVLTDSAAQDPAGGLPWAVRVFGDTRGRECLQLGRLRDGALGAVENGQFRPYEGRANGPCGDLGETPVVAAVDQRTLPARRTVVYGLSRARGPVVVRVGGRERRIRPGALGAFVLVYEGMVDLTGSTVTVQGEKGRKTYPLGRSAGG